MKVSAALLLVALAEGNIYLHSPRGSNNRLNENSAMNANDERLFFSNNNRRGGYNVGDKTDTNFRDEAGQYSMQYFQSGPDGSGGESILTVEWTNLLGCGFDEDGDKIHNCEIVIQSNCQTDEFVGIPPSDSYSLRNGNKRDKMNYEVDPNDAFDPQGRCYVDSRSRDLKFEIRGGIPGNTPDSIQFCMDKCKARGYLYAGVEFAYECFCDNDFGKYGEVPLDECNDDCQDGSGRKCGDSWRINVYLANGNAPAFKQSEAPMVDDLVVEECDDDEKCNTDDANKVLNDDGLEQYLIDSLIQDYLDTLENNQTDTTETEEEIDQTINLPEGPDDEGCNVFQTLFNSFFENFGGNRRNLQQSGQSAKNRRRAKSIDRNIGLHESWEFYDRCQDETGTRYGMECLNERNEWPYDSITPWVDVAYFTDDSANACTDDITNLNKKEYPECVEYYDNGKRIHKSQYTDKADCEDNSGDWTVFYKVGDIRDDISSKNSCLALNGGSKTYVWGHPMSWKDLGNDELSPESCIALPADVECHQAPDTRDGYLGNANGERETPRFTWALPNYEENKRCVMRIRYIISSNEDEITGRNKVVYTDGTDGVTIARAPVKVTFEDRSHVFKLLKRPDEIPDNLTIHNIVVRGKRGNIVQTYPAVEYDFVPNRLAIPEGDAIHFQWTGSNTHKNGRPGGDGQTGDAGEGRSGTDRNNVVQILNRKANFPAPFHNQTLFHNADWIWSSHEKGNEENADFNLALSMATSGYYQCETSAECNEEYNGRLNSQLDNADASFYGNIFAPAVGEYHYKCMRNDNFSNRHQKGVLTVFGS